MCTTSFGTYARTKVGASVEEVKPELAKEGIINRPVQPRHTPTFLAAGRAEACTAACIKCAGTDIPAVPVMTGCRSVRACTTSALRRSNSTRTASGPEPVYYYESHDGRTREIHSVDDIDGRYPSQKLCTAHCNVSTVYSDTDVDLAVDRQGYPALLARRRRDNPSEMTGGGGPTIEFGYGA
ncbi:hypothetical protein WOLCODRAFT_163528 [Wolfiporia cocos MD-104 SS10]|uniref:Uncharacterized protein n=1 Tax=Wolfiporia cocos (strain MD-104) TaxID=742152 RepID=A0A2H3JIT6_WOLCO|nr:hypothetical protein WOLCODRAFT_163528 [Wolfiporia cocos MD-104 SS10]